MREDFVLNEVSPQVVTAAEESLSGLLIAAQSTTIQGIDGDFSPLDKYYLDLRAMPVNLVIFYNALQTTYGSYTTDAGETIASNAECYTTKMGFPVPGYILGFMKNPAVVTYYTVKGESKFRGLFYPFVKDGITIKTLASAKPFGGRIGPHLFDVKEDSDSNSVFELKPLGAVNGGKRPRTCPYLMGLEAPENDHGKPGTPVPSVNGSFWVIDSSDTVGGVPTKIADSVKYGIPNMLYDYEGSISSLANASTCDGNNIHVIRPNTGTSTARDSMGLFDAKQYQLLQKNLAESGYNPGDSSDKLLMAVHLARRPTRYDAANYLIPMAEEQLKNSSPSSENIGIVSPHALPIYASIDSIDLEVYQYRIYAPLAYNGTIYQDGPGGIENTIHNYLNANMKGINIFIASLKEMRERLLLDAQKNTTNTDVYNKSADLFYPANPSHVENCGEGEPYSFASTYNHLFTKDSGIRCNVMPLREAINKYFASRLTGGDSDFVGEYSLPKRTDDLKRTTDLMTAYAPGKRQGVKMEAGEGGVRTIDHPFLGSMRPTLLANRNIYSTKFVHTEKLLPRENDPGDISYYRMNLVNYKDSGGPDITGSTSYSYPNSLLIEDLEDIQNKY
jgi:hypothetical protein